MIVGLSKASDELLGLLYKKYIERSGSDEFASAEFGNIEDIKKDIVPDWDIDTITKSCTELYESDLVYAFVTEFDTIPKNISLTDNSLLYMESENEIKEMQENPTEDPMNVLGFYLHDSVEEC